MAVPFKIAHCQNHKKTGGGGNGVSPVDKSVQVFRSITETGSTFRKTIKTELSCPRNQIDR